MTRLLATMKLDLRLQLRNGLYLFVGVSTVLLIIAVRQLVPREALGFVLPVLFYFYLGGTAFMFAAAQVLFEKGEGTLDALSVTPLRSEEYLLSKVFTLTALATLESLAVLLFTYGFGLDLALLVLGAGVQAALYALSALILVVRYDSVTNFLITSPLYLAPLFVPAVSLLGFWESPLFYLWPTQAPLVLIQGAFHGLATWQLVYALAYAAVFLPVAYLWAKRAYHRFIVLKGVVHDARRQTTGMKTVPSNEQ